MYWLNSIDTDSHQSIMQVQCPRCSTILNAPSGAPQIQCGNCQQIMTVPMQQSNIPMAQPITQQQQQQYYQQQPSSSSSSSGTSSLLAGGGGLLGILYDR